MREYKIPSMTPSSVHDYLYLTGTEWPGQGELHSCVFFKYTKELKY